MDDPRFPLPHQIACIVLTALFLWTFMVARNPRQWRRLFQAIFCRADRFSINRNKVLDERITRYGIIVAMVIFVIDVGVFVAGMSHRSRIQANPVPVEEWQGKSLQRPFNGTLPGDP
jgi:hypothetical protein